MTETVHLPADPHTAAAVYLAVMAYPHELEYRARFLSVMLRWARSPKVPFGREHRRHYDHAVKRIAERRMPAGRAAEFARLEQWGAAGITRTIQQLAATATVHADPANFTTHVWADSKPVLPLILAFRRHATEDGGRIVLFELIARPQWLAPAVASAARWTRMLPVLLPDSFREADFIRLVSDTPPCKFINC
jgi:hypothetical protein